MILLLLIELIIYFNFFVRLVDGLIVVVELFFVLKIGKWRVDIVFVVLVLISELV